MPTEKQLAANRQNAKKSTGPKTPEGRAAVRLNGVKHGLTAETLVLPGESQSDFDSLLGGFESEHRPSTPTEEALVRQMAMAQWRLRRLYHVEAAFLQSRLDATADDFDGEPDPAAHLAHVVDCDSGPSSTLANLSRVEARLERSFYKALRELQRLKANRPQKVENQTQSHEPPQPQPSPFLVKSPGPVRNRHVPDPPPEIVNSPDDPKIGNM